MAQLRKGHSSHSRSLCSLPIISEVVHRGHVFNENVLETPQPGNNIRERGANKVCHRLPWWLRCRESVCTVGDLVLSLGWEDPLEESMATHSSFLTWRIPMDRGAWWATLHEVAKSQTQLRDEAYSTESLK